MPPCQFVGWVSWEPPPGCRFSAEAFDRVGDKAAILSLFLSRVSPEQSRARSEQCTGTSTSKRMMLRVLYEYRR